jgi:hypothetical protein
MSPNSTLSDIIGWLLVLQSLGPHSRADCQNHIPHSHDICPKCHLLHTRQALGNVPLHEGKYGVECLGQI